MIPLKNHCIHIINILHIYLFSMLILFSCGQKSDQTHSDDAQAVQEVIPDPPGLVQVKAVGLTLEAPDEIPSGWTTFRLSNETDMIHFGYIYRVPEGKGVEDHKLLASIFQNFMDDFNKKPRSAPDAGVEIPGWFSKAVSNGGPGLISPREVAETTVFVEPGTYFIECYVKTNGVFHSYNPSPDGYGMVHVFTVTEESNTAQAPMPTINISVSGETGLNVSGDITAGNHVVGVNFLDQKVHENFAGHDVHLVRLSEGTNLDEVVAWMDWTQPTGLQTPAPAEFLGGTHEMPAGAMAYFQVDLEPGNYAWISEVPRSQEKGLLVEFEVIAENIP